MLLAASNTNINTFHTNCIGIIPVRFKLREIFSTILPSHISVVTVMLCTRQIFSFTEVFSWVSVVEISDRDRYGVAVTV